LLRQIVRQTLPAREDTASVSALYGGGAKAHTLETARKLRAGLDRLVSRLAVRVRRQRLHGISRLIGDGIAGEYSDYAGAEQATMAIASVLNFLAKRATLRGSRRNAALDRLHAE